jgi:hypothetical protein
MTRFSNPDAVRPSHMYLVCHTNKHGDEVVTQSENSQSWADYSTDVLNEHERNNARRESYYWRLREGASDDLQRDRSQGHTT